MQKLRNARLYGEGLLTIVAPELRERYNACLVDIGLTPTELVRFTIDGAGWSPEIAFEKGDPDYLGQSDTNRVAIIVSPDQRHKPLYSPKFSFEREILRLYFDSFSEQVADITTDSALWLEFDMGLSQLRTPLDLLLVDTVNVRSYVIGDVLKQAAEQRALCQRFLHGNETWFSDELRQEIIASAKQYGDLRERRAEVPEMVFGETRQFHTTVLGGVFVFRGLTKCGNVLVTEDPKQARKAPPEGTGVYSIPNPSWQRVLREEGLLQNDLGIFRTQPGELRYLQECLLVDAVSKQDPRVSLEKLTAARKQTLVSKCREAIPEEYFELERLGKRLARADERKLPSVEPELSILMSRPNPDLGEHAQAVLWQLICGICPLDVVKLYLYDKAGFYRNYQEWPENKKCWALGAIQRRLQRGC